jgi:hypothetical protein
MRRLKTDLQYKSFDVDRVQKLISTARMPLVYHALAGCARGMHIQLSLPDLQRH